MVTGCRHFYHVLESLHRIWNVFYRIIMIVNFLQLMANHLHRIILNIKDIDEPLEDDIDFEVDS